MPRASWCRPEIYDFFDRWRRTCLISDGSLFSDGPVWTDENLRTLQATLGAELLGSGTFFEKLCAQLASHQPVVRQLGVEIVGERDTSAATKRTNLGDLLDLLPEGVTMPDDLSEILDGGIASYGPGKSYRDAYVRFLLKLARRVKEEVQAVGAAALDDPWWLRDAVAAVRTTTDGLEANAVLHACFPDQFDVMISAGHRDRLLRRFGSAPPVAAAEDEDHKLLAVREVLRTHVPVAIDEPYDDAVRVLWDSAGSPEWDDLITRASTALSPNAADGATEPPEPDVDLLERLQHILETTSDWDELLTQAAVRVAARGGIVRSWGPLVDALRVAAESMPEKGAGGRSAQGPSGGPSPAELHAVTAELASELLMSQGWLQRLVDLLGVRRQLVLYGPPGTGKTWLARRIAAHAFDREDVRLIQFHPSYTYEDFVEGYRPTTDGGVLTYSLTQGPLRELSARAAGRPDRPHLLIIDEINRGNLPKIFGELYFLLEYRDEPLRLQYSSDEQFRLPPNLYVLGTMNTADRSIALLDAALRRRFAFVELSPDAEPVHGLLERWLGRHGLEPEPHVLLETLNALLLEADGDRDLAIGPSYFMGRHGSAPDLETVWEYDILPLLAERFHGTGQDVPAQFGLDAVRAEATRRADTVDSAFGGP
jgi:5-methylcytosine-specific restriction protein B